MNRFLNWLFKTPPVVGKEYRFDADNPFTDYRVVVTQVRRGWVQYRHLGIGGTNERPIRLFHSCYRALE